MTDTSPNTSTPADGPRKGSLFIIFLCVFIDLLGFGIVLPLLPLYGRQFSVDESGLVLGLLMASFSAMQFLFAPWWGRLSDRIGRRPVLLIGLGGSTFFYGLFGVATIWESLTGLFIARIGAGIAGATISTAQAYIADTTTLEKRTHGMALIGAAFGLGFTFGPLFGFLAVPSGDGNPGPGPGYAAAALSGLALLFAWFKLPESLHEKSASASKKYLDFGAFRQVLGTPSVASLLLTLFICVFAFANFETTLALIIKDKDGAFHFTFREVCLTFTFIGLVLTVAQGFLVRRLSKYVADVPVATVGAGLEIVGFGYMSYACDVQSVNQLFIALAVVVTGFAMLMPTLNSLISRRSNPEAQGGVLGLSQSMSALARIIGPMVGIPLLHWQTDYPLYLAAGLMVCGAGLIFYAGIRGQDFIAENVAPTES